MKAVMSIQIMICIIIILNLLISIVGNVFEDVNEKSAAYDQQELCNLIIEVEEVSYVFNQIKNCFRCKKKREPDQECTKAEYIHMCEYVKSNNEGSKSISFENGVRDMKNQMSHLIDSSSKQNQRLEDLLLK